MKASRAAGHAARCPGRRKPIQRSAKRKTWTSVPRDARPAAPESAHHPAQRERLLRTCARRVTLPASLTSTGPVPEAEAPQVARGFEPVQQEQMALQFTERHGSNQPGAGGGAVSAERPQAYRLLKALEHKGVPGRIGDPGLGVRNETNAR
jgi:hypothetical protein